MICITGINYNTAKLDIRGATAFTDNMKMEFLRKAAELKVEQCMVLSTCNRSEILWICDSQEQADAVKALYENTVGEHIPAETMADAMIYLKDRDAAAYLFRVAAGLESMVLGEDQILGQVREALDLSKAVGSAGKELTKLVREAVTTAKKIKTELKISENPLSVSYIGIKELEKAKAIDGRNILIIGSGKTAALTLKYLTGYSPESITVCSRNLAHTQSLKEEFPLIQTTDYSRRYECMENCSTVISATSSPHTVVKAEMIPDGKNIIFLDLAAPRDIDPHVESKGCSIINLDSLTEISESNKKLRQELVEKSSQMIQEDLDSFFSWLSASRVDPAISSLQSLCDTISSDSFEYLTHRLELTSRDKKILKKVLHASLLRLIREPIRELKGLEEDQQEQYMEMLQKLFGI